MYLEEDGGNVASLEEHGWQLSPLPGGQVQPVHGLVVGGTVSIVATYQEHLHTQ